VTKPDLQHYVPKVYLRQFQIDDDDNKNFVYAIDFANKFRTGVQKLGIGHTAFKRKKYYNDSRLEDPYIIEKVFACDFEPKYVHIMQAVRSEKNLPEDVREDLIGWLFITQMRAPHIRDNTARVMSFIDRMMFKMNGTRYAEQEMTSKQVAEAARDIHLGIFSDPPQVKKFLKDHIDTLNAKHWRILKSLPHLRFVASDSPGFSPNVHPRFALQFPFHRVMELNASSIIFFVLSPDYCLEITPFLEGMPLTTFAMNMDIAFKQADEKYIRYINAGTFMTKDRLLISHSAELLTGMLKDMKQENHAQTS
jgi:hypothetical protein